MAGGIDWFRWHHGSVTDPKFQLVARRSGASLPDVLAVWAYILEKASASADRGDFGDIDAEALDCLFNFPNTETRTADVMTAMQARGLIDGTRIVAWEKRQPKRERDQQPAEASESCAKSSTERSREHRARKAASEPSEAMQRNATQCNASNDQKRPREEESREESNTEEAKASSRRQRSAADLPDCPFESIVTQYHEKLPELPSVRLMSESRKKALRNFWRWVLTSKRTDGQPRASTADQALTWISAYFERASSNDFLMGRRQGSAGHENWRADFDFLLTERGLKHVIERTVDA